MNFSIQAIYYSELYTRMYAVLYTIFIKKQKKNLFICIIHVYSVEEIYMQMKHIHNIRKACIHNICIHIK